MADVSQTAASGASGVPVVLASAPRIPVVAFGAALVFAPLFNLFASRWSQ